MRKVQYIAIAVAIILIALLYWGGNTTPPAKNNAPVASTKPGEMSSGSNTVKPASFDSILSASRLQLTPQAANEIKTIENELSAIHDSSRMAEVFIRLAKVWEKSKLYPVAGFYSEKAAKLENSEKMLNFAGQFFLDRVSEAGSESVQQWEMDQAAGCFQRSLELDKNNDTASLGLANIYVNRGEIMKGVGMLREITQRKPDNIPANMMLGALSVQSGQLDKAIGRFETILKVEPKNSDAMLYLAEIYEKKAEKEKAIEYYKKFKQQVKDPEVIRKVDEHINSLK